MDGQYLNDRREIKSSIQNWIDTVSDSKGTWEGNNLHIDEIGDLKEIERHEWVYASLAILNILSQMKLPDSLILFLHFDLSYSLSRISLGTLSLNWLKHNISEYTPPSINCTSFEYYNDFYKKELKKCQPDKSVLKLMDSSTKIRFFYRTYFDVDEEMYSREIYVFVKIN